MYICLCRTGKHRVPPFPPPPPLQPPPPPLQPPLSGSSLSSSYYYSLSFLPSFFLFAFLPPAQKEITLLPEVRAQRPLTSGMLGYLHGSIQKDNISKGNSKGKHMFMYDWETSCLVKEIVVFLRKPSLS